MNKLQEKREQEAKMLQIKTIEDLIEVAGLGRTEEMKSRLEEMESKANENVNSSTNANWYDAYGVVNAIKDMSEKSGKLLSRLQEGYEGDSLPESYPIPFDITDYFMLGKAEWVNEARPVLDNTAVTSSKSTLTQVEFILQIGVTDKMIRHSTDKGLFDKLVAKATKSAIRTMEGCIINGDNDTGATGNVNSDDQAPATTFGSAAYHSLKIDHGIRELAINNSKTLNVSTFDSDDLNAIRALLGSQYMDETDDLLFLAEPATKLTVETDDALKLRINTNKPTVDGVGVQGSSVMTPFGVELISHPLVPKTEADGKMSGATLANNVKGQILLVYKPAIRWGFGENVLAEVERIQGYGFEITVTMEFSFVILDGANTCAAGINVTL